MSSQTSLVAKQCRIQSWAMQIKDCQNRPEDMTIDEWCVQNNLTKANYYYRLKCVRQACLDSIDSEQAFIELPVPEMKAISECTISSSVAVIRGVNGISIEIQQNASAEFLKNLIGALSHAQ